MVTKLKKSNCDQTQNSNCVKIQNSNCDKAKKDQIVTKPEKSNFDKIPKLKW